MMCVPTTWASRAPGVGGTVPGRGNHEAGSTCRAGVRVRVCVCVRDRVCAYICCVYGGDLYVHSCVCVCLAGGPVCDFMCM